MSTIGRAIRVFRVMRGLTATELARRSSISVALVSQIEAGNRSPSVDVLQRFAAVLDVEPDVLILLINPDRSSLVARSARVSKVAGGLSELLEAEQQLMDAMNILKR